MTIFKGSAAGCVHKQTGAHASVVSVQMSDVSQQIVQHFLLHNLFYRDFQ